MCVSLITEKTFNRFITHKTHYGGGTSISDGIFIGPRVPGVRSMGPVVSHKQTEEPCADLTDVTLADEDTNSILTDNANRF